MACATPRPATPFLYMSVTGMGKLQVQIKHTGYGPAKLKPNGVQFQAKQTSAICVLSAKFAAEQTQIVTCKSTIAVASVQGKEKYPDLEDGGTGFPPRRDGGGGCGGGGRGGNCFGFFGFLAFLAFLKDQNSKGLYRDDGDGGGAGRGRGGGGGNWFRMLCFGFLLAFIAFLKDIKIGNIKRRKNKNKKNRLLEGWMNKIISNVLCF